MNAAQLIELLSKYAPDTLVMVPGYEGGFDLVREVKEIDVVYAPQPWCGEYDHDCDMDNNVHAILLRRGVSK